MPISILYSGIIDSNTKPYALINNGEKYPSEVSALQALSSYFEGSILSESSEMTAIDTTSYFDVPNIWAESGYAATAKFGFVSDLGLVFNVGGVTGSFVAPSPNGSFSMNSYSRMQTPVEGAVFIHLNGNNADIENAVIKKEYSNGTYLRNRNSSNRVTIMEHVFFSKSGVCIFFYTHPSNYNGIFGIMGSNSLSFNEIGTIEPLKLYTLRASPAIATGKVYDLGGQPASRSIIALNRKTKKVVGECTSNSNGEYSMPLLAVKGDVLTFICFDDDAPPDVQAEIVDRVIVA